MEAPDAKLLFLIAREKNTYLIHPHESCHMSLKKKRSHVTYSPDCSRQRGGEKEKGCASFGEEKRKKQQNRTET
jgi:hypothetical protein